MPVTFQIFFFTKKKKRRTFFEKEKNFLWLQVPYFQLRENCWTLNAYMDGKWDVRFDV
jgi:hypothetical protein